MPGLTTKTLPAITPPHLALHHTRFSNWFSLYRRYTPKATVIDLVALQPDFVDWLEEDGLILPKNSDVEDEEESEVVADEDEDEDDESIPARNFDVLNEKIRQVLATYEGAVFPKLDWSAPLVSPL
jgi:hypothetical protein